MIREKLQSASPILFGIAVGLLISILFGALYLFILGEPGSAFYAFAALVFLVGPLLGSIAAAVKTQGSKFKTFATTGSAVFALFIVLYAVIPNSQRVSVKLPTTCDGNYYLETAAVISSWGINGQVRSRPHLIFHGIARGCFVAGDTHEITRL